MTLYVGEKNIDGEVDFHRDGCSGSLKAEVILDTKLKLYEHITKGDDICANGMHIYDLKHQIISQADSYILEGDKHKLFITNYKFIPKPNVWNNVSLKLAIEKKQADITALEKKLEKPRLVIEQAKVDAKQAQYQLDHNHTGVYLSGQCVAPPLAVPKPDPFFDSKEKAKQHALAYCSVSFSCRVGVELARNKLDNGAKRFLASQSCSMLALSYQKERNLADETMFNLLDAASFEGCDMEAEGIFSGIMKGGSCIMSTATRLARVNQYIGCIDYKTQEFYNTYLNWKNAPKKRLEACQKDLDVVNRTPNIIEEQEKKIEGIQHNIKIEHNKLKKLNEELKKTEDMRKLQSELLNNL